jgi:hypothetical protein
MKKLSSYLIILAFSLTALGCSISRSNLGNLTLSQPLDFWGTARNDQLIWSSDFTEDNWEKHWGIISRGRWGHTNAIVMSDPTGQFKRILRVRYPSNSASPTVTRQENAPVGGTQFYATLNIIPQTKLRLSYYVRFSPDFNFVKGGKLPGLYGGTATSGGNIPDGTNGFSTRYMWRRKGAGEIYAYLPTSKTYGTSLGRGNWYFQPGKWYKVEQKIALNQPGKSNGIIQVWVNNQEVLNIGNVLFRKSENLQIEGIFFSTFFGGSDSSWATPKDVYIDFTGFSISK